MLKHILEDSANRDSDESISRPGPARQRVSLEVTATTIEEDEVMNGKKKLLSLAFAFAALQGSAATLSSGSVSGGFAAARHSPTDLRKPSEHQKPYSEQYSATSDEMANKPKDGSCGKKQKVRPPAKRAIRLRLKPAIAALPSQSVTTWAERSPITG